ncbi:hypothetical protein ACFY30_22340 [Streptomyces sp. NPDC000345]|uniref:hypothetical protein n=1 Tax=Streptomyces sp. NPDC000345 TaxID=3364537 RepID=UPI0036A2F9E3
MPTTPLPTVVGCALHDAGHDWDAIRVPRSIGLDAIGILGQRCGAVVADGHGGALYFFTPVGTAAQWDVENTRPLGKGSTVTIPPARRTEGPGVHWRICPGDGRWLTEPGALHAALADAFGRPVAGTTGAQA